MMKPPKIMAQAGAAAVGMSLSNRYALYASLRVAQSTGMYVCVRDDMIDLTAAGRGLRERKKQATRDALAAAAMRLTLRHGLEALRIEDIAAEADVSVRTFNNYFSNKYEALTAQFVGRMRHVANALHARPADELLWDAIINAVMSPWSHAARGHTAPNPASAAELRTLFAASSVRAEVLKAGFAEDNPFAAAVARRSSTDIDKDLYPRLVAAAVTGTIQVAIDAFLKADPPVPLVPLLREALEQLSEGLPDPSNLHKT